MASESFDLIHAHFGQAGFLACLATRIPVVVTFHGSDVFGVGRGRGKSLASALLRSVSQIARYLASSVIAVSPLVKEGLGEKDAHVIPMGINRDLFRPLARSDARRQLGWPLDERTVLFVGGANDRVKRFWLAQEAVSHLASTASFPVALRVCDRVPPDTMPLFLNAADVLVITSVHEGSPVRLREALACGLPVVSVDVGDARTRLAGITGCIVTASDSAESIASALISVLREGKRVDGALSLSGLDDRTIAQKLIGVYEGVLAHRR